MPKAVGTIGAIVYRWTAILSLPAALAIECNNGRMSENRLQTAIDNWLPRFTANGVEASDLTRITEVAGDWSGWCGAWSGVAAEYEAMGREAMAAGETVSAGEHLARAATYFHFAKFLFTPDRGAMASAHRSAVGCLTDSLPHLEPPGRRIEVVYQGSLLPAVLRIPKDAAQPAAVVVLVPGLDSTKEELRQVEASMLARGLATLAVDGPGQGEAEETLAIEPAYERAGAAIIDRLQEEEGIDPERIGVWGVSLGGYYAARMAAADERIKACVSLSGPYDLGESWDRLPGLTREAFRERSHSADDEAARRRASDLTLRGRMETVRVPLLVIVGKRDRLFDWREGMRMAEEAEGKAETILLEEGNHGCANLIWHHRPQSADFLARHLIA